MTDDKKIQEGEKIMLQAVTITEGCQNIDLKTNVRLDVNDDSVSIVKRRTVKQHVSAQFPIFAYNIGLSKVIIHNTLNQGQQYVM